MTRWACVAAALLTGVVLALLLWVAILATLAPAPR